VTDKEIGEHFGLEGATAWRMKTGVNGEKKALLMKVLSDLPIEYVLNRIELHNRDKELLMLHKQEEGKEINP
jgi:hypothetical protein